MESSIKSRSFAKLLLCLFCLLSASSLRAQGPPFQTDDPVPVDFKHYEFYIFGGADGTPAEMDFTGPAFEFNWGAVPRVQIHAILPWGGIYPSNKAVYYPGGTGPSAFGLTDMELGAKIAYIKESKYVPQIGTFTMFEMPTGNSDKGLGVGKVWYKLPLWLQKNWGQWTARWWRRRNRRPAKQYHNFPYGGFLVKRELNKKLELAAEVFAHGGEGFAARADAGLHHDRRSAVTTTSRTIPTMQFLFAMATPSPAKQRTTHTSACTGPGAKTTKSSTTTTNRMTKKRS